MQTDNKLLDDLARVAGSAMGAASGVRGEFESVIRRQFERILGNMDLVSRDEFDAVKEMAAKARSEQEELEITISALESRLAELEEKNS